MRHSSSNRAPARLGLPDLKNMSCDLSKFVRSMWSEKLVIRRPRRLLEKVDACGLYDLLTRLRSDCVEGTHSKIPVSSLRQVTINVRRCKRR